MRRGRRRAAAPTASRRLEAVPCLHRFEHAPRARRVGGSSAALRAASTCRRALLRGQLVPLAPTPTPKSPSSTSRGVAARPPRRRAAGGSPARRAGRCHPAGHGARPRAPALGEPRGDQRAGRLASLARPRDRREAGHDPVARREAPAHRRPARAAARTGPPRGRACGRRARGGARVGHVGAAGEHGERCRRPPASAPRCAAASIPSARPLTTVTPAAAEAAAELAATSSA